MSTTENNQVAGEVNKAIRNFKSASDVESFYRFVYENDLRREAYMILKQVHKEIAPKKKRSKKAN